jgi:DNA polymerase III sliding clamp (beta) subunit (PCNA family)
LQIRISKLRAYLSMLGPAVPKKPTLKVTSHVLMAYGKMIATDLDSKVTITVPEVKDSYFLLPYKPVQEQLQYVGGDEMLDIDSSVKGVIKLTWINGSTTIPTERADDFPNAGDPAPKAEGLINGDIVINALIEALPYCAADADKRPVLNGVTVYLGDTMSIAAADGFRMSYQAVKGNTYPFKGTMILTQHGIKLLAGLWRKQPANPLLQNNLIAQLTAVRQIKMLLYGDHVKFEFDKITLDTKLIVGTPPDHLALLQSYKSNNVKVKFIAAAAYQAVRQLMNIAKGGNSILRVQWTGDLLMKMSASSETGSSSNTINLLAVEREDPENKSDRIAMNCKYFADYLADKNGVITMAVSSRTAPPTFIYGNHPLVAIMPMMVQWDDEPQANKELKEEPEPEVKTDPETGEVLDEEVKGSLADDVVLDYDDNVEVSNRTTPLTVGDVRKDIQHSQEQAAGWTKQGKTEQAKAWDNQVTILQTFLEDNGDCEAETVVDPENDTSGEYGETEEEAEQEAITG